MKLTTFFFIFILVSNCSLKPLKNPSFTKEEKKSDSIWDEDYDLFSKESETSEDNNDLTDLTDLLSSDNDTLEEIEIGEKNHTLNDSFDVNPFGDKYDLLYDNRDRKSKEVNKKQLLNRDVLVKKKTEGVKKERGWKKKLKMKVSNSDLLNVVRVGTTEMIRKYIENHSLDVNYRNEKDETPLLLGIRHRDATIVNLLLSYHYSELELQEAYMEIKEGSRKDKLILLDSLKFKIDEYRISRMRIKETERQERMAKLFRESVKKKINRKKVFIHSNVTGGR